MINLIKIVNERIIPTLRVTDNFWSVYLVKFGVNKKATIKFRNGTFLDVTQSNYEDLVLEVELQDLGQEIIDKMNVSIKEDVVTFISEGKSITADRFSAVSLVKEFYLRLHEDLPVRNKVVLDIGCYVGDSPLYYIIKGGALKVYGYEINKKYAAVAKNNVRYNNLEDRIKIMSMGVGNEVGQISLDKIVEEHNIQNGALKIDVEGAEYEIFKNALTDSIRKFDVIHVEYHYGEQNLPQFFEKLGYKISIKNQEKDGDMNKGDMFCVKQN